MLVTFLKDYKHTSKKVFKKDTKHEVSRGLHRKLVDGNFIEKSEFSVAKQPVVKTTPKKDTESK